IFTEQDWETTSYQGRVFAQPFDLETMSTRGPAVFVLPERGYWEFGVNRKGDMVTTAGLTSPAVRRNMALSRHDPETGAVTRLVSSVPSMFGFDLSPDGEWIVFSDVNDDRIKTASIDAGIVTPLPQAIVGSFSPHISSDGSFVIYSSGTLATGWKIYRQRSDGSRPPELVDVNLGDFQWIMGLYEEDRTALIIASWAPDDKRQIVLVDLASKETLFSFDGEGLSSANLSPDGRWIAYTVTHTQAETSVYVVGLDGSGPWLLKSAVWDPRWSIDGETLYVRSAESVIALPISTTRGVRISGSESVLYTGTSFMDYRVDGSTGELLILDRADLSSEPVDQVDIVFNWGERLKALAPAQ
ncbi:MAG: hypothetical protein R3282_03540, partial [Rhodothermales bacterium]|nr:hypothetical protein [Rhodothermales bacterium]